ncbi:pyruvate kinase [Pseudoxanthomonas sp. GM95]|uniref:pyruvate kinase n=1 Tax=Pseudoxanthomonas sp. GM95 TaxID=1881043 RepID=UPI0008AE2F58|nr:pyruvate kinase [Pseudoxanthomonas sp. GM95]SEL08125.1 pyruvate kinase [Pseudoxanthomonas sp. GM95]
MNIRRERNAKIVATLGPATNDREMIAALFHAGVDVFRLNLSHGLQQDHAARVAMIRDLEREACRPVGILLDLQGPKLRIGTFTDGPVQLAVGAVFRLDLDTATPGDITRVALPHPEILSVLVPGAMLLLDDGRIQLRVETCAADFAKTVVVVGGRLSERKGLNVPGVMLPISALTKKDRADLAFGLGLGVDWVALSFVQRVEDLLELRELVQGRAAIVSKLEKPAAIDALDAIVQHSDAVMVARGDLGVEMPAEQVPSIQRRIVRTCRRLGRPVIVATQMLESMVSAPTPTRAEASDVATAIYDGADAVMLSAESASGAHPVEAVRVMDSIIRHTERDPYYRDIITSSHTAPRAETADAIGYAVRHVTGLLNAAATVAYTSSGYSAIRMARERPATPIIGMTPDNAVARRLSLVWGVHPVICEELLDAQEVSDRACSTARAQGFGTTGQTVVISAGMPFGTPGTTNVMRIAQIQ